MAVFGIPVHSALGMTPPQLVYVRKNSYTGRFHPPRQLHRHDYAEIRLVTDGSCDFTQNDRRYVLSKGDMLICNAGSLHAENFDPKTQAEFLTVAFTNINIPSLPPNCIIPHGEKPVYSTGNSFRMMCSLIEHMYTCSQSDLPGDNELGYHALCTFLLNAVRISGYSREDTKVGAGVRERQAVRLIKEYIDSHYAEDLTLEGIGDALNFSPSLVSHAFKEEVGCSPIQYMTLLRIGEAQTLLANTSLSITDIADRIGYNTPNNFYIMFKKNTGVSPTQYRRNFINLLK